MNTISEVEAAAYLGVSASTLTRWRRIGVGPAFVRLGLRLVAYRPGDLDAYIASRVFGSRSDERAAGQVAA